MKAVFTFGRINPPTIGHQRLFDKVLSVAKKEKATPFIFVSSTQDNRKNPLTFQEKINNIKSGYKLISKYVSSDPSIKTVFQAMEFLIKKGYDEIFLVVGSDRVDEFNRVISPYLNTDSEKSMTVSKFQIVNAGSRDPDSSGIKGMSASKLRQLALSGKFDQFAKGVLPDLSSAQIKKLYDKIRSSLQENALHDQRKMIESLKDYLNRENDKPEVLEIGTDEIVSEYIKMIPGQIRSY